MEYYDVIIIGAGIAGCGLAYNLKRIGYMGSVLVIDKDGIGSNEGYRYKIAMEEDILEYNLPYVKKFKGLKIGPHESVHATIERPDYFVDYKETCECLFNNSEAIFLKTEAKSMNKNRLIVDNTSLKFKYLIDCSGVSFFLRKFQKKVLPNVYWIGFIKILKGKFKNLDKDYYYYMFGSKGTFEDFYIVNDEMVHGYWQYTRKIDHRLIKPPKKDFFSLYVKDPKILMEKKAVIPNSPIFPLVHKNTALLGDSFGIPYTASGLGLHPILESSKILSKAIKINNLKKYEKWWKKRNLKAYSLFLASRLDRYFNNKIMEFLKKRYPDNTDVLKIFDKNPESFNKLLNNEIDADLSMITKKYPKYRNLFVAFEYISLRIKYLLMMVP